MGTVLSNIISSVSTYYVYVSDKIKNKVYVNTNPNKEVLLSQTDEDANIPDHRDQSIPSSVNVKYQLLKNNEDNQIKIEELTREINMLEVEDTITYKTNYDDHINLDHLKESILNVNDYDKS